MEKNKTKKVKISVIIPAKDEEETIGKVLTDVQTTIKTLPSYIWEILVIADHCTDKTAEIAKKHGSIVLTNPYAPGKGNALKIGFTHATGDVIVMMDADYSHRAEDMERFLTVLAPEGVGMVIGSRSLGGSDEYTFVRVLGNVFLTSCVNLLFGLHLSDGLNGYKALKSCVIKDNIFSSHSFEIEIELIYHTLLEKQTIIEISSHERRRAGGKMKSHAIIHGTKFLWCILKKGIQYNIQKWFQ